MVKVIKQLVKPIAQPTLIQPKSIQPGISLVELLIATTVLATAAVGVFQLMSRSETQLFESRNALTTQQVEEAIGSYVYDDFLDNSLSDNSSAQRLIPLPCPPIYRKRACRLPQFLARRTAMMMIPLSQNVVWTPAQMRRLAPSPSLLIV